MSLLEDETTSKIIKAYYNVYNKLGYGFLERVYENALCIELVRLGLNIKRQESISVLYENFLVGNYIADIIVEGKVIIELKAVDSIIIEHECQLINYLKATEIEVGLILNFGRNPQFKRKVFTNKENPRQSA